MFLIMIKTPRQLTILGQAYKKCEKWRAYDGFYENIEK